MKSLNITTGLWLGNLLGMLALVLVVVYQLGEAVFTSDVHLPDIRPLVAQAITQTDAIADIGSRNPFDSSATRWKIVSATNPSTTGELRGVILLPGVQTVVTSKGTVRVGETLTEGRVTRILDDKIVVDQGRSSKELELPSAKRPTLKSINKADHGLDIIKGSK